MRAGTPRNDVRLPMDKIPSSANSPPISEYVGIFWKKSDKIKNLYIFLDWSVEVRKFISIFKSEKDWLKISNLFSHFCSWPEIEKGS